MRAWRILALTALALTGMTALAAANEDDGIMGNYQGGFTDEAWSGKTLRAQVVGLSEKTWKAVLFIGENGQETRVEVKGRGRGLDHPAKFDDEVDLGSDLGGTHTISGVIEKQTFTGTITGGARGAKPGAFTLERATITPPTLGMAPPEGAVVLYGEGVDPMTMWRRSPELWCIQGDGSMQVCDSSLVTRAEYGSGLYHAEFMTPYMPNERYQGRGNSGFYVLGRYEVQVLDSFGTQPAWDLCGGIYKVAIPAADAVLPPLQWQTYDITFTAPEFDAAGQKTKNARINVVHNGVTVHDNLELPNVTPGGVSGDEAVQGVLMLQNHGDPVSYRNIWFKPAE
ncbi:MAG: DUF1080 domain-containing protein [Candidatus Hydrogenedens sp.]|nr:DUF1080 domain-containing protein [Candidatus Hydrogenedens sp.]